MSTKFDNLRHRPFLVIIVTFHPAAKIKTERKGWKKERENLDLREHPLLVDRINDRLMRQATVIIDITENAVIKNRIRMSLDTVDPDTLDLQILHHFSEKYHDIVEQGRNAWGHHQSVHEFQTTKAAT